MGDLEALDKRYEAVGWSLWLIWLGLTDLISGLPAGTGTLGTGLILVGLNLARYRRQIPVSDFSTVLGVILLILGAAKLLRPLLTSQHIELPFFPVLLVVIGALMMIRGAKSLVEKPDSFSP
jgi:hypothetical protein